MKSLWPVLGLIALSWALPPTPAECIILWTEDLFRSWIRVFVYTSQPSYYYPSLTPLYPQHGGNKRPVRPKPPTVKPVPFWPGSRIPWDARPGRPKPTTKRTTIPRPITSTTMTPKPTTSTTMFPKPTTSTTMIPKPTTSRTTVAEPTTVMPRATEQPVTTAKTSTESQTEVTKRRFYNMTCGNCPPKKQCLCPGLHF